MNNFYIGKRKIGAGQPVYIVAEMSANHHQSFDEAVKIIHAAKEAGADAIKIQTYTADTLTLPSEKECFRIKGGTLWDGKTLHDLYQEAYTPWDWQPKLKKVADELNLDFFSSPFDATAVDFLESLGMPVYKLASFELIDVPLIEKIASTGKPIIMSTGMATVEEIQEAVDAAHNAGASEIAILKCTSAYPAPPQEMNLTKIPFYAEKFQMPVGLSDHTMGYTVAVAAVALGACIIEKHLTISRKYKGPDSDFSMEPAEFKEMVDAVRIAEKALGSVHHALSEAEEKSRIFRRSLFAVEFIKAGEVFTTTNIRSIRPAYGLAPKHLKDIINKHASRDLEAGMPLTWECVQEKIPFNRP